MADAKDHQEITNQIIRDWNQTETSRDNGSMDLVFARRTQWDDDLDLNVDTEYRGQFDIVKPERRRILDSLTKNEYSNRFRPKDEDYEGLAEVLQDHYRATVRTNDAKMAAEVAISEAIDCGVGAWRLEVVEEDDTDPLNTDKKIIRGTIHEANTKIVWDSNAKLIDKSDAKRCTIAFSLAKDAYTELMEEHGLDGSESEFHLPDYLLNSSLEWRQAENYTIAEHYHVKERKQKITIVSDGEDRKALTTGQMRKSMDWLADNGYEKEATKTVITRDVWKTVLTGARVISNHKIAGKFIPVIPVYGEWSFVQDFEMWEGIVRMLRDPQQMRNTTMSYVFDLLAKGPIEKDIYAQEQIDGYEHQYEEQNQYKAPYYLQNLYDESGEQLPLGPLGKKGGPSVPAAAQFLLSVADQAVSKSVGGGVSPEQMVNPQVTDDQIRLIQQQLDIQTQLYKEHLEYSYRREGQIYASIMSEISDTERTLSVMANDGSESKVVINEISSDFSDLSNPIKNDMSKADMEVYTDVGLSFTDKKDKVRNEMLALMDKPISEQDRQLAQWTYTLNLEGTEYEPMRKSARKQMVMGGYVDQKDLTDDEEVMLQQAQQQPPAPDPMMVAAQAENKKGDADIMDAETKKMSVEVNMFNAQTKRLEVQIEAEKLGITFDESQANIQNKNANTAKVMRDIESKDVEDGVKINDAAVKRNDSANRQTATV